MVASGMGLAGKLDLMNALLLTPIKTESGLYPRMTGFGKGTWNGFVSSSPHLMCYPELRLFLY